MKKSIFYLFLVFQLSFMSLYAQVNPWLETKSKNTQSKDQILERPNFPEKSKILTLDSSLLKTTLNKSTTYQVAAKQVASTIISMPTPDGDFIDFEIYEQKDLEDGLSKKFPNLKSYTGYSTTDKTIQINFTTNALGFNAVITSPTTSAIYIDSYSKDLNQYIIYYRKDLNKVKDFSCLDTNMEEINIEAVKPQQFIKRSSDGVYRDYKIAIACTVEYSNYHINRLDAQNKTVNEKKEIVLSAIQTSINRVNVVYKRDLAIHLTLVNNNDDIIFLTPNGLNNGDAFVLINQSQTTIDQYIGNSNYDIGHTFSTGAGGLASLYTPCNISSKAKGVTGSSNPINDPYDIDYVAHEIGHQFGATHTFNNSCEGNREAATAFEPGSGSTIMAYAGICAPNVTTNSDDYFHYKSIEQIQNFISTQGNCSLNTPLNNRAPNVDAIPNYTIPYGTPYKLTARATDPDNDTLTYTWDQLNNEIVVNPPISTSTGGPSFKSIKPTTNATRYFPSYESVLNENISNPWEVLSTVSRTIKFGLTVRDNNNEVGQTTQKENTITVANTGPFMITFPNDELTSWEKNSTQTIKWNVAGTTTNGINVTTVNILLSTDGGATYQMVAENTPNDGSESITLPDVLTKEARIMIEANGNIFYAVSKNFMIGYSLNIEEFCNTYTLTYNAYNIADVNTGYLFNFLVNETDNFAIKNIKLGTDILADQTADVNIYFKNAGETDIYSTIVYRNTSCSSIQNLKSVFENSGTQNSCFNVNTSTVLKPNENFTAVNKMANGTWSVIVSKNNANRNVKINKLNLTLCGEKYQYTELGATNTDKKEFAIYPNPSKGIFRFNFYSSNNINVTVFDLTGKLLVNNTFNSSGNNTYDINLSTLAKGVYIFKASDGNTKKTQKIIIN